VLDIKVQGVKFVIVSRIRHRLIVDLQASRSLGALSRHAEYIHDMLILGKFLPSDHRHTRLKHVTLVDVWPP